MNISNDVSSFKGFAVQAGRDCVKESKQLARRASKGSDLLNLQIANASTMTRAAKAFNKGALKLEVRSSAKCS